MTYHLRVFLYKRSKITFKNILLTGIRERGYFRKAEKFKMKWLKGSSRVLSNCQANPMTSSAVSSHKDNKFVVSDPQGLICTKCTCWKFYCPAKPVPTPWTRLLGSSTTKDDLFVEIGWISLWFKRPITKAFAFCVLILVLGGEKMRNLEIAL